MTAKIVHLSTSDITGGAARAAHRLHRGLMEAGYDSTMYVYSQSSQDTEIVPLQAILSRSGRIVRRLLSKKIELAFDHYRSTRPDGLEMFSQDRSPMGQKMVKHLPVSDVVNLHWVAGFLDYRTFFSNLSANFPLIWTLHDMNPFTGGCHYTSGCTAFQHHCGACPQLGSKKVHDLSAQILQRKHQAFANLEQKQLHVVAPSTWLAHKAAASTLLGRFPVSVIPNSLDTKAFAPRDCWASRHVLGLPLEAKVILFAAQSLNNRRKGFSLLIDALALLPPDQEIVLLCLGDGGHSIPTSLTVRHVGNLDDDGLMAAVYSAADLFVIPSLEDNLPNTVLESLACGTPVVGFDTGGIPDMVRPGITGELAPLGNVQALALAISHLLADDAGRAHLAVNCRRIAVDEFSLPVQAMRYLRLYESMLEHNHG